MPALVSIIMPTYNRSHFLIQAIQSVLDQTFTDFEILVVDDGSVDDTASVCERYTDKVRYIYQKNQGRSAARNRGIEAAAGQYVAFLDDDDLFQPTKLQEQVTYLENHHDMGMVHSSYELIDMEGNSIQIVPTEGSGDLFKVLLKSHTILPSAVMIRRSVLDAVGGFDESLTLAEDLHLWIRIARRYVIGEIRKPLVQVQRHDSNTTMDARKMLAAFLKIVAENREASPELGSLFWRKLTAHYYHYCGNHLLNTQPDQIKQCWSWLIQGLIHWPFSTHGWLLGSRLVFRAVIPLKVQKRLRQAVRRLVYRS